MTEIIILINPEWLAGFFDGSGSFVVTVRKNKWGGNDVVALIIFTVKINEQDILKYLQKLIGCGEINKNGYKSAYLSIDDVEIIHNKLLPILKQYSLHTRKKQDISTFQTIIDKIRINQHLTNQEVNFIEDLKQERPFLSPRITFI